MAATPLLFGWNVLGEKNDPMSSKVLEASLLSHWDMFRRKMAEREKERARADISG